MLEKETVKNEVEILKKEMKETEKTLSEIREKYSVFSESGRHSIVRECMAVIQPKIEKNLPKFTALAESMMKLGDMEGMPAVRSDLREILSSIKSALEKMASYGAENDKTAAVKLSAKLAPCIARVG
jgi:hypothetical protein